MGRIKHLRLEARRLFPVFFAVLFVATLAAQLLPSVAGATGQITTRSIKLGSSAPSTVTTYALTFTPVTTAQELIVDFCANDPLISDTCTFAAGTVPTVASGSVTSSVGTAVSVGSGSPLHTVKVTGLTETGGSPFTITLSTTTGITNPTTATSFYARILTYATGNASGYAPANTSGNTPTTGTFVDSGGIAISTAANISITSKVYETLAFCVFQTSCGTAPTLTLGDSTTGALSVSSAYTNANAEYTLATNAGSGVGVTMTGTTLCRSSTLSNCNTGTAGAFTITAIGNAQAAKSVGTEQFGMCVDTTGATGGLAAVAPYSDTINNCHGLSTGTYAGTSQFGFNDSPSTGTNSAAGDQIMGSTGALATYTGTFVFLGDIAATTEAGLYSTSLNLVATGTF